MEENYKLKIVVTDEMTSIRGEGTLEDYGLYMTYIGDYLSKEIKKQNDKEYLIGCFINGFSDNASQALEITESILEVLKNTEVEDKSMENLTRQPGYTVISNEEYKELILKAEELKELKCNHFELQQKIEKFKKTVLESMIDESNLRYNSLDNLMRMNDCCSMFGKNLKIAFELGFSYEEIIHFIGDTKEKYDWEQEKDEIVQE